MSDLTTKETRVATNSTTDCSLSTNISRKNCQSTSVKQLRSEIKPAEVFPFDPTCTMNSSSSTKIRPENNSTAAVELYRDMCNAMSEVRRSSVQSVSASVCYVIVSTSSLMWTTLTLLASALICVGLITPYWLVASPRRRSHFLSAVDVANNRSNHGTVSIGIFNECTGRRKPEIADILSALTGGGTSGDVTGECGTYVSGFDMPDDAFPDAWKSALILLTAAAVLMTFTDFSALASFCIQSIFGKSIFTVTGLLQSIAGIRLSSVLTVSISQSVSHNC